jgi:hypothetical protein
MVLLSGGTLDQVLNDVVEIDWAKRRLLNYHWREDMLFFKDLVVPKPKKKQVLVKNIHEEIRHFSEGRTLVKVKKRFFGMIEKNLWGWWWDNANTINLPKVQESMWSWVRVGLKTLRRKVSGLKKVRSEWFDPLETSSLSMTKFRWPLAHANVKPRKCTCHSICIWIMLCLSCALVFLSHPHMLGSMQIKVAQYARKKKSIKSQSINIFTLCHHTMTQCMRIPSLQFLFF